MEVTFDGGARSVYDRPKVAGAGATLWQHDPAGGPPHLLASCVIAIPASDNAQLAEVSGCRAGLSLLAHTRPDVMGARIVGDNLAAVRYGAGTGRYRRLPLATQMDLALRPLLESGWSLTWQAVRRRLNKAGDRLATLGVFWADALRARGDNAVRTWIVWHGVPAPANQHPPPFFPGDGCERLDPQVVDATATRLEAEAARWLRQARAAGRA